MLSQRKGASVTIRLGAPRVSRWLGQPLRAAIRVHVSSADVRMVMREAEKTIIPFPSSSGQRKVHGNSLNYNPMPKRVLGRSLTVDHASLCSQISRRGNNQKLGSEIGVEGEK